LSQLISVALVAAVKHGTCVGKMPMFTRINIPILHVRRSAYLISHPHYTPDLASLFSNKQTYLDTKYM